MVYIEKIRIINYKKFKDSTIEFKEKTNIIVGNNEEEPYEDNSKCYPDVYKDFYISKYLKITAL